VLQLQLASNYIFEIKSNARFERVYNQTKCFHVQVVISLLVRLVVTYVYSFCSVSRRPFLWPVASSLAHSLNLQLCKYASDTLNSAERATMQQTLAFNSLMCLLTLCLSRFWRQLSTVSISRETLPMSRRATLY
jgi:hypothetical protein